MSSSNIPATIPSPPHPKAHFAGIFALSSGMYTLVGWPFYLIFTYKSHGSHIGFWIVLLVAAVLGALTGLISFAEAADRRSLIARRTAWNGKLTRAQNHRFPVVMIRRSGWETTLSPTGLEDPQCPEPPPRVQIVFLPVGITNPKPLSRVVAADMVCWNGVETGEDEVEWPDASIDDDGRITSYGPRAIGSGAGFRAFPLLPDPDSSDEDLRWQIAPGQTS